MPPKRKRSDIESDPDDDSREEEEDDEEDESDYEEAKPVGPKKTKTTKKKMTTTATTASAAKKRVPPKKKGSVDKKAVVAGGRKKTVSSSSNKSDSNNHKKDEIQQSKSPAEFFAENQSIAGFDNAGKSLYTTLRELIENSLDACESVNVLPDVFVNIEEMTQSQFNVMRGVPTDGTSPSRKRKEADDNNHQDANHDRPLVSGESKATEKVVGSKSNVGAATPRAGGEAYFLITVRDNGCGMAHDDIPELLGRVLSGSKYGVRQTRGKFGLGAKMALIWSKKSTGVPIRVRTSHVKGVRGGGGGSLLTETGERRVGPMISHCVLDIGEFMDV
jgi:hypothetical protein